MMNAHSALALKIPSGTAIDEIQEQIYTANKMDKKIGIAEQAVRDAESMKRSPEYIRDLKQQVVREKEKKNAARTRAIHMAILAYGLEPQSWSGTSVMPWTKGRKIHWQPVAREREARQIQNAEGEFRNVKQEGDCVGITFADGVTYMDPSAFEKGPGYLASYLLHERIHFEQFTTRGKGNTMTYAQAQEEAYQAQVDNAAYFFDPKIRPDDLRLMQDIARLRDDEKAKVDLETEATKGLKGLIRRLLPAAGPPDVFESKVHTNAELADISGLVAQARGHADIARREREERETRTRAAAEKNAHDEQLKRTYLDMAIRSCANPGSVTQTELNALADPYDKEFVETPPRGLGACEYMAYMSLGRGADAEQLRRNSIQAEPIAAQPEPPPFNPHLAADPKPAQTIPGMRFSSQFPLLKDLAVKACNSPAQVSVAPNLIRPYYGYSFERESDDRLAAAMSAVMDYCPRQVFNKLIEKIRSGQGSTVDDKWLRDLAAQYPAPVYVAPPRDSPPTGCIPGDNSRRNCIACGNTYCP